MGSVPVCLMLLCLSSLANANRAPTITYDGPYFVCEDVPEGNVAFTIEANDPDGDPLTYTLSGLDVRYFTVDASGDVFVAQELDRELKSSLDLTVRVSDGQNSDSEDVVVIVNDANDNRPFFEEASYEATLAENAAVGKTLFKVLATDADTGLAGSITYTIEESLPSSGLNTFRLDNAGNLILQQKLNYNEISTFYRLKIKASDKGGKCFHDQPVIQSSSVFAFITVEDIADLDPEFVGIPYIASVEENSAIGTSVITVSALDPDLGISDKIIYSIQDSTADDSLFGIDQNGVISVKSAIDREEIGDTVGLTVKATETNQNINGVQATATVKVSITISDLNDNSPLFYQCSDSDCDQANSFTGEVVEHSLGAVFINMTVMDADKNAETLLSLDGDGKDIFMVQPQEAFSDSPVQLSVKNPEDLDYEKIQEITLKVIAVDKKDPTRPPTTADVTITILDANDHSPVFDEDMYSAEVPEHCPDGTVVADITAQDPDTMDQGKLTYSLLTESMLFDVESTTGRVFVKNGSLLDREIRALYSVTLQARDSDRKPGSTMLEITVTDINDKTPKPNRASYPEFVSEGQNLENVKIEATDGDEPDTPNSELVFSIEPSQYSMNFTIDPDSGVLTNNGPLDREDIDPELDGRITLNVTISDKGKPPLSSSVPVIINVQDVNDNKPEFEKLFYNFTVKESDKGAFVGLVYAEDLDQKTEFNRISFSIVNGGFGSFMVSSVANPDGPGYIGQIRVDQDIELDYESERKVFTLQVEARDLDLKKAEVTVEVTVLDVNDERPEFEDISPVRVDENSEEPGAVGTFVAVDKDTNHSLVYELVSVKCRCGGDEEPCDWFFVEPSGEVKINPNAAIDYEVCDQATVEAQVVDEYTEIGESNSLVPGKMVINIVDVNDNAPQFTFSDSVFAVVAEIANAQSVVATVTATDRDSGTYAEIVFQVLKAQYVNQNNQLVDADVFEAETTLQDGIYVGRIQLTQDVDVTLTDKYIVTVEARDKGGLTNTTELEMFVVIDTFRNQIKFALPVSDIRAQEAEIKRDLTISTQAVAQVVSIEKEENSEPTRATEITVMVVYLVFGNGTAIDPNNVMKILAQPENYKRMEKYDIIYVGTVDPGEPEPNIVVYALLGIAGVLILLTGILTTALLCTRRNFRRRLKAANAMKSVSDVMSQNKQGGPVVPGTNLYTMDGANPVLNLNIDSAIALDLGEEESDVDNVSLNSLVNDEDMTVKEKNTKPKMKSRVDEDRDSGLSERIEPLGAALAQRDQKIRSNNPLLGNSNPLFDTTDL